MSNNLKFEFNFDEVIEGIKCGVIKELTDIAYENIEREATKQAKDELLRRTELNWSDKSNLKDEVKNEIKDKVFKLLIDEIRTGQKEKFDKIINETFKNDEEFINKLKNEIVNKTVERVYDSLIYDAQKKINKKLDQFTSKLINNLGGNNITISEGKDKEQYITKEEYDELIHRNEILEALEQGGVDNWEWYGESISQYFDDEE